MSHRKFRSFLESVKKYDPTLVTAIMEAEEEIFGNDKEKMYKVGQYELSEDQFFGREEIEGSLFLDDLRELPEGFAPKVGGDLWLNDLEELPADFAATVGGVIALSKGCAVPDNFPYTVDQTDYARSK